MKFGLLYLTNVDLQVGCKTDVPLMCNITHNKYNTCSKTCSSECTGSYRRPLKFTVGNGPAQPLSTNLIIPKLANNYDISLHVAAEVMDLVAGGLHTAINVP